VAIIDRQKKEQENLRLEIEEAEAFFQNQQEKNRNTQDYLAELQEANAIEVEKVKERRDEQREAF